VANSSLPHQQTSKGGMSPPLKKQSAIGKKRHVDCKKYILDYQDKKQQPTYYIFFFLLAGQRLPVKYTQHAGLQKAHCRTKKIKKKTATSWALRNNGGTSHQKCGIEKNQPGTPQHCPPWRNGDRLQKWLVAVGASTHRLIVNFCYYPAGQLLPRKNRKRAGSKAHHRLK